MPVSCEDIFVHLCHFMLPQFVFTRLLYTGHRSFPGLKRPGRGDRHSPPFIFEVANGFELYLRLYPVPAYAYYMVTFTFPLTSFYWGFYYNQQN